MNGSGVPLARALRGPVTLITLGVLFAFNNFTQWGFEKTWPVLLIVFGLLSLMRRAEPGAYAPPPVSYVPPSTQAPQYNPPPVYNPPPAPAGPAGRGGFGTTAPPRAVEAPASATEPPASGGV